jgi:hypothetical protein
VVKCELVKFNDEDDEFDTLFEGTIDCDPAECGIIMHKGQAFIYSEDTTEAELAVYTLTKVAEFTEGKD